MNTVPFPDNFFHSQLRKASDRLLWVGIAMLVLGIAAIVFPMVSTLVATYFVGWLLLVAGCCLLAGSFAILGAGPFFGALLLSLLLIGCGIFMLFNPVAGAAGLTLVVGMLFMLQGAFELFFALELRPYPAWSGVLISAILSIAMALLVLISWPGISLVLLGVLIGVNFISTGIGYIVVSRGMRR